MKTYAVEVKCVVQCFHCKQDFICPTQSTVCGPIKEYNQIEAGSPMEAARAALDLARLDHPEAIGYAVVGLS